MLHLQHLLAIYIPLHVSLGLHAQASELLELIDPAVLPKEYGGQAELAPPLGK
jgi:hypothetical protein